MFYPDKLSKATAVWQSTNNATGAKMLQLSTLNQALRHILQQCCGYEVIPPMTSLNNLCQSLAVIAARLKGCRPWLSLLFGGHAQERDLPTALFLLFILLFHVFLRSENPPELLYGFWEHTHFMVSNTTKAWKETRHWEDRVLRQTIRPPWCCWLFAFSHSCIFFSLFPSLYLFINNIKGMSSSINYE